MCCTELIEEIDARGGGDAVAWHLELDPKPRSAATARRYVLERLGPLDPETGGTLELLTSELVTNAILHARTPLVLGVARSVEHILVCVGDRNLVRPRQQPYSEERTDGRGIVILEALAERWGIATDERGKVVWFSMRLSAARNSEVPGER